MFLFVRRRYAVYQRGDGLRKLMINKGINPNYVFGRRSRRRRRMQRGAGFMDVVRTVGRIGGKIILNPIVKKVAKDFIIPMAVGAIHKKMGKRV